MSNAKIDDLLLLFWPRLGASMNEVVKFLIVALVSI